MTDTSGNQYETNVTESKSSVNTLRSTKPSANIAGLETTSSNEEKIQKIHEDQKVETFFEGKLEDVPSAHNAVVDIIVKKSEDRIGHDPDTSKSAKDKQPSNDTVVQKTDTVMHKVSIGKDSKDEFPSAALTSLDKKIRVSSATSGICHSERIIRNQSDIFSLKEEPSMASSIFSVNGSPSRKVVRRREVITSNVFPFGQISKEEPPSDKITAPRDKLRDTKESYLELKRPSSSVRNPLTGTGLSSNDEYRFKGAKRKDGNPLLGLGYSPEATPSAHRIPPGGYSHKLW